VIQLLEEWMLYLPALFSVMFGAFWYPSISKKDKSSSRKLIEAAIIAGLISLFCYTIMAIYDFGFLQFTLESRLKKALGVSFFVMFGTGVVAQLLMSTDKESQS